MIITTDESLIDQIEKSNNISSLIEMAIPPKNSNSERSTKQVSVRLFCTRKRKESNIFRSRYNLNMRRIKLRIVL
jgi:hypothetical protein